MRSERRLMAYSAAAMYGGAAFVGIVEGLTPNGPAFTPLTGVAALALVPIVALLAQRLPRPLIEVLGPLGAAMIAYTLATTSGSGDGAVLYAWPALWSAYFFGRWGTVRILVSIGIAHAIALACMPDGLGYFDRWIDVMVSVTIVAAVVRLLSERNESLVRKLADRALYRAKEAGRDRTVVAPSGQQLIPHSVTAS